MVRLWIAFLLLWPAFSQTVPPQRDAAYAQLRTPKLSGEAVSVADFTIQRDAATFVFSAGTFYFLEPVMGRVPGAVFIGEGEFRIVPPIAVEKHHLAILAGGPGLTEPFTELVLHFTDGTHDEIVKDRQVRREAANSRAASLLEDRLQLLRKGRTFSNPNFSALSLLHTNLAARLLADFHDPARRLL